MIPRDRLARVLARSRVPGAFSAPPTKTEELFRREAKARTKYGGQPGVVGRPYRVSRLPIRSLELFGNNFDDTCRIRLNVLSHGRGGAYSVAGLDSLQYLLVLRHKASRILELAILGGKCH